MKMLNIERKWLSSENSKTNRQVMTHSLIYGDWKKYGQQFNSISNKFQCEFLFWMQKITELVNQDQILAINYNH